MSFCPQCGAQIPDSASFCPSCGAPLAAAPAPSPQPAQPYQQPQYFQQAPPAQPYSPVPPTPPASPKAPKNKKQQKKARGGFVKILLVVILLGAGYFGYNWLKDNGLLNLGGDPDPSGTILPEGTDPFGGALSEGEENSGALGNIIRDFLLGDNTLMGDGFESLDDGSDGFESLEEDMTQEERASYLEALMGRSQDELNAELAKGAAGDQAKIKEIRDFLQIAKEELNKLKQ